MLNVYQTLTDHVLALKQASSGKLLFSSRRCLDLSCSDLTAALPLEQRDRVMTRAHTHTQRDTIRAILMGMMKRNSHHGDVRRYRRDVFKVSTVAVELQIPTLTLGWYEPKY